MDFMSNKSTFNSSCAWQNDLRSFSHDELGGVADKTNSPCVVFEIYICTNFVSAVTTHQINIGFQFTCITCKYFRRIAHNMLEFDLASVSLPFTRCLYWHTLSRWTRKRNASATAASLCTSFKTLLWNGLKIEALDQCNTCCKKSTDNGVQQ